MAVKPTILQLRTLSLHSSAFQEDRGRAILPSIGVESAVHPKMSAQW